MLVFRDVSERRAGERLRERLLERARAAHEEAQAANHSKDEFLAVLSHELRTPLQGILGWAQVLQRPELPPSAVRRAGAAIERSAQRQSRLVEDVLDVSRIVSGKLLLASEPVALGSAVAGAVDVLRSSFEAKGVALVVDVAPDCDVIGDPQRLEQVVSNLLSNAVKFTPAGGRVELRCAPLDDHVELSVRDTGCGIHADFLPHVFDRFRQEGGGTTRSYAGLGLGLAIVRHIVEMHGGSVHCASDGPERGATFTVRLPRGSGRRAATRSARERSAAVQLSGVRVLVVDDEADARELVEVMLRPTGAELRLAGSVREALAVAAAWRPDVVVSDLGMPEADGYELLHALRASGLGDVPAVALTANASDRDNAGAIAEGFERCASKPIGEDELRTLVRDAFASRAEPHDA